MSIQINSMTLQEFKDSLSNESAPMKSNRALHALWHAGKGNWNAAHELTQAAGDPDVDWVHAYLHRDEGDLVNAGYWYRRAGKPVATVSLQQEWEEIAAVLLNSAAQE